MAEIIPLLIFTNTCSSFHFTITMSSNRKKRLSIIDFFGKSSDSSSSSSKNKKGHTRSSSSSKNTSSKTTTDNKTKRLTFTIPNESIVHEDYSKIPIPLPKNRSNRNTVQINSSLISSPVHSNHSLTNLSNNSKTKLTISSPVSPVIKNGLSPNGRDITPSRIYGMNSTQTTPSKDRLVSNSSLSSSVYPNDNLRNVSNSTLPEINRVSSSIYPPSTILFDNNNNGLKSTGTIKRSDLLKKRKPPPLPLVIDTNENNENENKAQTKSPVETIKHSATESYESSDSGFSPLNLINENSFNNNNNNNLPLSQIRSLNPSKNVMFTNKSVEYDPPEFISQQYENNDDNNNIHKHSRTLSSIEEITSALDNFQLEHEKSFDLTTSTQETNDHSSYIASPISDRHTIDLNIDNSKFDESVEYNNNNDDENDPGMYVKVKDLPQVEGETLDEYIDKLKDIATKQPNVSEEQFTHPIAMKLKSADVSEASSSSDIFYDVPEAVKKSNEDVKSVMSSSQEVLPQEISSKEVPPQEIQTSQKILSQENITPTEDNFNGDDFNYISFKENIENGINENGISDEEFNNEEDFIGPLNDSFESFVKTINTSDNTNDELDQSNEINEVSTNSSTGGWQRYSSATNFFSNYDDLNNDNNDDIIYDEKNLIIEPPKDITGDETDENVVTPTDTEYVVKDSTPQRDFDLEDELDNNIVEHQLESNSMDDFFPKSENDEYVEDDSNEDSSDDTGEEEPGEVSNYNRYKEISDSPSIEQSEDDFLEFSPKPASIYSGENNGSPDLYRQNSMFTKGVLEKMTGGDATGTPVVGGGREHLKVVNNDEEEDDVRRGDDDDEDDDDNSISPSNCEDKSEYAYDNMIDEEEYKTAPIPDLESVIDNNAQYNDRLYIDDNQIISAYDRREEAVVKPIEHSNIITTAVPITGWNTNMNSRNKRPPPNFAITGRRSRGLSETTANPELFTNSGIKNEPIETPISFTNAVTTSNTVNNGDEMIISNEESRKGEKCTYVENLRTKGRKTTITTKPSLQVLPIAIRQNGSISHRKIPSQQLFRTRLRSHKHITVKPKTRMLASEIDDGELPDATKIHSGQRTKVPIHPDAAVIAASEQFARITNQRSNGAITNNSGELGRFNSVMSVRPHYGDGMKLFITNPDSDDD